VSISKKEAIRALWERGCLNYKLHAAQKEIYDSIKNSERKIITVCSSRRIGKSFLLLTLATEICSSKPGSIIKYICPRQKQVKTILKPIMQEITSDCPNDMRPEFKIADRIFLFPNGSEIQMEGSDNENHENIRGGKADLCIVDEAGFCSELEYVVRSVLFPTVQTTNGKVILISTPSDSPDHPFITMFMKPAEYDGSLIVKTIYDNPMLTQRQIDETISEYPGGVENPSFQREFLCKVIIDEDSAVIPEFTEELQSRVVKEWKMPSFYDAYVSMDPGFKDLTAVLFAYYDFEDDKVIIEDEIVLNGPKLTTDLLAELILDKESELFFDRITLEPLEPYMRVSDNNLFLINDLQRLHGITFIPTAKDDKTSALNKTRMLIAQGRVIINPRCSNLIKHIKGATWTNGKKTFARSPDNGHYDCVDALIYLLRNISFTKNPYPEGHGKYGRDYFDYHNVRAENKSSNVFKKIFKID